VIQFLFPAIFAYRCHPNVGYDMRLDKTRQDKSGVWTKQSKAKQSKEVFYEGAGYSLYALEIT